MTITNLAEYRYRVELAVLRRVTRQVLAGEVDAFALCVRSTCDRREEVSVLGAYRTDPAAGLAAAMRMSIRLNQLADENDQCA